MNVCTEKLMIYALNENDTLVHVDEVPNGNACGCKCPSCKNPLMARHGLKRRHSFAHQDNSKKCAYGLQTSLHILAKEIIKEGCEIKLPPVKYGSDTQYVDYEDYEELQKPLVDSKTIIADDVSLEKRVDDIIPDIILVKDNELFLIEIYVTHPVDEKKKKRIIKSGISAIEFNLSKIDRDIDKELLKDIFKNGSNCEWIYNTYSAKKTVAFNRRMEQKRKELEEYTPEQLENEKQEMIAKYGINAKAFTIEGPINTEYVNNPPCPNTLFNGKNYIQFISECKNCKYFIKRKKNILWCRREQNIE